MLRSPNRMRNCSKMNEDHNSYENQNLNQRNYREDSDVSVGLSDAKDESD